MSDKIIEVTERELALVDNNSLNANQLGMLFKETPESHIYERPAKGGGKWKYVTGIYIKKVLNLMFGWDWDFEVIKFEYDKQQVRVLGKLTCRIKERQLVKMQFGRADIKYKKDSDVMLDLGNDLKAATTDALKKCASEIGIASDIYGANEFKAIKIVADPDDLTEEQLMHNKINDLLRDEPQKFQEKYQKEMKTASDDGTLTIDYLTTIKENIESELSDE